MTDITRRQREYVKFQGQSADTIADAAVADLVDQGIDLGHDKYYNDRFTIIVISHKGTADGDDSIIVSQSTTFPDRLTFRVDDTVSETIQSDSIGYIKRDTTGAQEFTLYDRDGSRESLRLAVRKAALGDVGKVSIRISPTLNPEYTNPKFTGNTVSYADLNLEAQRQDLIVLRIEESRGLFGSRDTTSDPLAYGTLLPTPKHEGELFVLRRDESIASEPNGLWIAELNETTSVLEWIFATSSDASIVPYNYHRQLASSAFEIQPRSASESLFGKGKGYVGNVWKAAHDHELFLTPGTTSSNIIIRRQTSRDGTPIEGYPIEITGFGDITYQQSGLYRFRHAGHILQISLRSTNDPNSKDR